MAEQSNVESQFNKSEMFVVFLTDGIEELSDPRIVDADGAAKLAEEAQRATDGEWHTVKIPLRIVEAAPQLFEALKPFADYLKRPTQPIMAVIRPEEWERVISAISKATGK